MDDFAHNPAKIEASLATAHLRAQRVLAVYQPHGYGPTRFLRDAFVDTFATKTRPGDRVWLLEIFYAGGAVPGEYDETVRASLYCLLKTLTDALDLGHVED